MSVVPASQQSLLRRLWRHPAGRSALVAILLLVALAVIGPLLDPYSPNAQLDIVGLKNAPPSWAHPLGTDQASRDLLSRILTGARISLGIAAFAVALSVTVGTTYGLVSGYIGGALDTAMMRVIDGLLSIPRVLFVMAIVTLWNRLPFWALALVIGGTGWFGVSRLVRAETLLVRHATFVEAARALGAPTMRTLWRHILPNIAAPVIVFATLSVGNTILLESGLSYLGAGTRPPTASWGALFSDGMGQPPSAWWMLVFPGLAIVITVLAFNVLGDVLRDVLDPRQLHGSLTPRDAAAATSATPEKNG